MAEGTQPSPSSSTDSQKVTDGSSNTGPDDTDLLLGTDYDKKTIRPTTTTACMEPHEKDPTLLEEYKPGLPLI